MISRMLVLWVSLSMLLLANILQAYEGVDEAKESLKKSDAPWYNTDDESIQPVDIPVNAEPRDDPLDPGNRESDWQKKTPPPKAKRGAGRGTASGLAGPLINAFLFAILAIVIGGVVGLLIWVFLRVQPPPIEPRRNVARESTTKIERVEALPFDIKKPVGDLLSEVRRCMQAGNFVDAAIYWYSYLLTQLDQNQHIHLVRGKTNRQYLREIKQTRLQEILHQSMVLFEDAFFGRHDISRTQFEQAWSSRDEFQRLMR